MSNEKQETVADIVARMRDESHAGDASCLEWVGAKIRHYADRIEAAATREREAGAEAAQACGLIGEMAGREAARRSDERTAEKYSAVGNAAAMREALLETKSVIARCMEILNKIPGGVPYDGLIDDVADEICDLRECHVNPALSAPQRNCDVGTAEEQEERFHSFCNKRQSGIQGLCSPKCPCILCCSMSQCLTKWSQMPYEEGGAK